ncbi:MaoC/PaaZ C-terminal domain-containing protein [Rothia halotolerans]|uniref:MaoC/PaaZ C-terminal domain-containing protein n=1 Tax=Rothia halotolerans TaxID=405770 RepID=UPI001EE05D18|nr:MaoC/PaaZ C-terminal domain-containing protein [Rothia halotolerans]
MGLGERMRQHRGESGPAGTLARVARQEARRRVRGLGGSSGSAQLPEPSRIRPVQGGARVDARRHAAFVAAVAGEATPHAHGGFLHALTFPVSMRLMTSGRFPLGVLGLVHLRNSVRHLRPVEIGSSVRIRSSVVEFGSHRRGTTVTILAEVWDDAGKLAFRDESLYLALGKSGGGGGDRGERPDPRDGARRIARWRLPASTGRAYAAVSGDINPIHLSTPSAKALGMKGMIAHGMYAASRALGVAAGDASAPGTWSVEFGAPIRLPAEVSIWRVLGAEVAMSLRGVSRSGRQHFAFEHMPDVGGDGEPEPG